MAIKTKGSKQRRIRTVGSKQEKIDFSPLSQELGAEKARIEPSHFNGPAKLLGLRTLLFEQLTTKGGRPSRENATTRKKISFSEVEWQRLSMISKLLREQGEKVAPGQIAGALVSQKLDELFAQSENQPDCDDPTLADWVELEEVLQVDDATASALTDLEDLKPVAQKLLRQMKKR